MTVLEIARAKVKDPAITEVDIMMAVVEIAEVIKNYCNIEVVPEALNFTHANMAVDLVKYQHQFNLIDVNPINDIDPSSISSIKIGDTQVTLGGSRSMDHKADLDVLIMNYRSQLNKFRRLVW